MSEGSERRLGVLLHPTSLPGPDSGGDLGPAARHFVDFLVAAGVSLWQTLPLGPTHGDLSPYTCLSVHAGNPALISLAVLEDRGWIADGATANVSRNDLLRAARHAFVQGATDEERQAMTVFVGQAQAWLDDYALYQAIRQEQGGAPWWTWPAHLRDREVSALADARMRLADDIMQVRFEQFVFFQQWHALKLYANERDVLLFGDMPIFVAHDSAEVWAHREYFALDRDGQPQVVAGVPPDYFSETGQRWGNPLYRWQRMQTDGFEWWLARMRTQLELFDLIRIDHFRGFEAYWEIPASEKTAVKGRWVPAPGAALFTAFQQAFHQLPIVAEDLGLITPAVEALREQFEIPGMAVLQFAFEGGPTNPYLPHRHRRDLVVYTGTHDNDTTLGWFQGLSAHQQAHVRDYLGEPREPMPWPLVRAAAASVADLAILPMQDVLGLGAHNRMNTPGTSAGNWQWRFQWEQVTPDTAASLRHLAELYGRLPQRR
jgi:4-alpha-glucanotransferase